MGYGLVRPKATLFWNSEVEKTDFNNLFCTYFPLSQRWAGLTKVLGGFQEFLWSKWAVFLGIGGCLRQYLAGISHIHGQDVHVPPPSLVGDQRVFTDVVIIRQVNCAA